MSIPWAPRVWLLVLGGVLGGALLPPGGSRAWAQAKPDGIPTAQEVENLVRREPFSLENWPTWRGRLLAWITDRSRRTDAAYDAARDFLRKQAGDRGELPAPLARDALAWYFLGSAYLRESESAPNRQQASLTRAERALNRSIELDPNFARAHRNLALVLMLQDAEAGVPGTKEALARSELDRARRLDPDLPLTGIEAQAALLRRRFAEAEQLYQAALRESPDDADSARGAALAIVWNRGRPGPRAPAVNELVRRFPHDGVLACLHAVALAEDDKPRDAVRELQRARGMGTDPRRVLPPELVDKIEEAGAPGLLETFAWVLLGFAVFYALVMGLMALAGVILARRTEGTRALELLEGRPTDLVAQGQVVRTRHESGLARLYATGLFAGLILFYLSIPFILAGLLAATGLLLYLIFMLPRIPIKLIVIVVVVGLGGAWAVLKSLFAAPSRGSFGLAKTPADCPRLYEALNEVARRVDTDPVDQVYLAPGSSIGVHQEGRGPFGVFGVKQRVLTLGLSTLHFLTVDELKAILAHEYAHFSHKDTFYSRFIYQVSLSIQQALDGMARAGGNLNYVNPFYWFLVLYHKSYSLLSAGFSRSREFLADRMASSLYGSDVFARALTKVSTDGSLFEMTIYDNIAHLLNEGKAFVNMYDAFRSFRDEQLPQQEREELYRKLLDEKASLFASHPTFGERIQAVSELPRAEKQDPAPALQLFDNPEEVEKELTEFMTGYIQYIQHLQAQAAAQAAQG